MKLAYLLTLSTIGVATLNAGPFFFSTGNVDGRIALATRPGLGGKIEIETADDFVLNNTTFINSATFTGLLVSTTGAAPTIGEVVAEMYRVFPNDSNVARTSGPPNFSTPEVPTRVNSPSDVAFDSRDNIVPNLSFTLSILAPVFSTPNSILNGIHPFPNQNTLGDGPVTGQEVQFNVTFTTPFSLAAGHYFFVPQVQVTGGEFYWLSSVRPIVAPGTPFNPDLQAWIRNDPLDPDWLRAGTDIVGGTTFNTAFTLAGTEIPEPA